MTRTLRSPLSIAQNIKIAHSRIAPHYGLTNLHGTIETPSYAHWNLERNGLRFMKHFYQTYFPNASVLLDAGCGNGQFSQIYLEWGMPTVIGVDFSREMLEIAVQRAALNGYQNRFIPLQANLDTLFCLRDSCVDVAHLFGVIEHLDNPLTVLAELVRVVKQGGFVLFSIPRKWSIAFWDYLLFGQSPHEWGTPFTFRSMIRFSEKLKYYRFYSNKDAGTIIDTLSGIKVIERKPFAHCLLHGKFASPLYWLAKRKRGYQFLDAVEAMTKRIWTFPGAEYILLQKVAAQESQVV